jgi:nitroreductase
MNPTEAIQQRRSIKRFTERPVSREELEKLLDAAVLAPNHRLTQPWRFYVLGPEARHAYGLALGNRKAKKIEDPETARATRETVAAEHRALPAMIAVAVVVNSDNEELREENYAAAMMAIENLSLVAVELGLGTHLKTGAIMGDPAARAAAGVTDDSQKIVAIVNVGVPAEMPAAKNRQPASALTTWVP